MPPRNAGVDRVLAARHAALRARQPIPTSARVGGAVWADVVRYCESANNDPFLGRIELLDPRHLFGMDIALDETLQAEAVQVS